MFTIFTKLGGEDAALDALHARMASQDVPRKNPRKRISKLTIKKWKWKRQIPGAVILLFEAECLELGIPFDISDCRADAQKEAAE